MKGHWLLLVITQQLFNVLNVNIWPSKFKSLSYVNCFYYQIIIIIIIIIRVNSIDITWDLG